MKYFSVTAKCGHVGRSFYYEGTFFVRAESASEGAKIVRQKPRVKHHHKDAILSVCEISYQEFLVGQAEFLSDPYFNCKSKQEQKMILDEIESNIFPELNKNQRRKPKTDRLSKLEILRKCQRKSRKHPSYLLEA